VGLCLNGGRGFGGSPGERLGFPGFVSGLLSGEPGFVLGDVPGFVRTGVRIFAISQEKNSSTWTMVIPDKWPQKRRPANFSLPP
jgi:hypothetical protein